MRATRWVVATVAAAFVTGSVALAAESKVVPLPKPQMEGGKPLMQALKERKTSREFSPTKLPDQLLSNLLWAANGVNRRDGRRTAPTAVNWQEIDIYVATADGLFLFDAGAHALKQLGTADLRAETGTQPFVGEAPVELVFVADLSRMGRASDADKAFYSATDTGYVSQNVYLFCASEGLNTVVRGLVDRPALAARMGLRPDQKITLVQTVGYPKTPATK